MSPLLSSLLIALIALPGCQSVSEPWTGGWAAQDGENKIMSVQHEPVSLGYKRLAFQAGVYPDLALFFNTRGWPQFTAETTNDKRHYIILYYLRERQAYACRTLRDNPRAIEFAGPYPITDREEKLLKKIDTH